MQMDTQIEQLNADLAKAREMNAALREVLAVEERKWREAEAEVRRVRAVVDDFAWDDGLETLRLDAAVRTCIARASELTPDHEVWKGGGS